MINKLQGMRKNHHQEQIRAPHYVSTEFGDNSYKDNDYETSSAYLSKLEGNVKKFNVSMYDSNSCMKKLTPELAEVDPQFEATPASSTKKLPSNGNLSPLKESRLESSSSTFRDKCLQHLNTEKKRRPENLSQNNLKARRVLQTYIQRDSFVNKKLTPLRHDKLSEKDLEHNHRYMSVEESSDYPRETPENRLAKIYVRSEKLKEKIKHSMTIYGGHSTSCTSENRNGYLRETNDESCDTSSYTTSLKITKPLSRPRLRQEIWRLPRISNEKKEKTHKRHNNSLITSLTNDI
jgi:hypothetical protein